MAIVTLAPHVTARHRLRRMRRTAGQNAHRRRKKAVALYWRLVWNTPELKVFCATPDTPQRG